MAQLTGLVVEDEWLLRMELTEELGASGWLLREAGSGEEALQLVEDLQAQGGRIDFLVTDIRLGGPVDGWTVAEACREVWPSLPVLYVSANPIDQIRQVHGSAFLSKPVQVSNLLAAIKRLIGGAA